MIHTKSRFAKDGKVNVAVILLQHMSNFTDFNPLELDSRVHLFYTNQPNEIENADIIIIPGTKSTLHDLQILRRDGLAQAIIQAKNAGKTILGICGGYQIMGSELFDPSGVESDIRHLPGLNLLPIKTTLEGEKITKQVKFTFNAGKTVCAGYEIHNGRTEILSTDIKTLNILENGSKEGCFADKCFGTYMHGILENAEFVDYLIQPYLEEKLHETTFDYLKFKEEQYDKLADHVRNHVNMDLVYSMINPHL